MARLPRLEVVSWPHLVAQHVHEGHLLFRDRTDRDLLKKIWLEEARERGVCIHAYCISSGHFHLLLTPQHPDSLSVFMQSVGRRYVSAYNRRHGRAGGLWAGRYRATVVDPDLHLLNAMVWVETQGRGEGVAAQAQDDVTSSAPYHLGLCSDPLIVDHALFWALGNTPFERQEVWQRRLEGGLTAQVVERLADAMHKGWALVSPDVLPVVEALAGRRLVPRPRGRPKKIQLTPP